MKLWWQLIRSASRTRTAGPGFKLLDHPVHHFLTVQQGEVLGPAEFPDVTVELGRAFLEVGQVRVRQDDVPAPGRAPGLGDVPLREFVADAARAGVQEQPHGVRLIRAHLDEVVARAQRSQLQLPVRGVLGGVEAGRWLPSAAARRAAVRRWR